MELVMKRELPLGGLIQIMLLSLPQLPLASEHTSPSEVLLNCLSVHRFNHLFYYK